MACNLINVIVPKVSIIVPIFKVRNFIERCACSLFEQTLEDIEYIFVDDVSPDNSVEILKSCIERYPERKVQVRILTHLQNMGVTAARNTGLKAATGTYIAYCDSDDYVERDMYKSLYDKAEEINADLVYCDFYFKYRGDRVVRYSTVPLAEKGTLIPAYIGSGWAVVWNMIAKRELYERYALLSPRNITYCEDFHLSVRLMHFSNIIGKVNLPLYYYNQENEDSIMHSLNKKQMLCERLAYDEIIDFFKSEGKFNEYQRELSWRVLKNKQDLVLDVESHGEFMTIHPWSHKMILSCPESFCNRKIKIMMWMLTHRCRFVLLQILWLRKILNR